MKKESGPIKEDAAIKIMYGLLAGFSFAHTKNIVHRDVKSSNIIISRDFATVKILDFGIAKILGEEARELTKNGIQVGTIYYMSPEQVTGSKLDSRSDIYSLGNNILSNVNWYKSISKDNNRIPNFQSNCKRAYCRSENGLPKYY
ncbi:MAG: protein kinase [Chitinophagaceae bacterium]|nr:protein kinase [Chitinophagaceae bacterium]